ncbi:MAG: tRNA 4-thiouridine(8) synthase ThiI [Oscillospiraceae bacterium]|nr:tRNA 4-thiouridine(8) synthase ThiI [Oscillospiraceae bacterium]
MKEVILIKDGEIALKGLNRNSFEETLMKNVRRRIKSLGKWNIRKAQSTIYLEPLYEDMDIDEAVERIKKVFGIAAFQRSAAVEKDFDKICEAAVDYLEDELMSARTFKVAAKRSDKSFPYDTPKICAELGGYILERFPHLTVDVHNPDVTVIVEIRDFSAYIHASQIKGAGGMPLSTSGKAMLLLSGGIDSPVAGYLMAKRGVELAAIHFVSPPYTSERAKNKVLELGKELCDWCGRMSVFIIPFTEIQEKIRDNCREEYFTVIMRRFMMRIAEMTAREVGCGALITGESIAQVASQTMEAIACTDKVAGMPVFRPLIGWDKNDIIEVSRKIGTFETSIQPYEDCCTVFTPKHPKTHPTIEEIEKEEERLEIEELINKAFGAKEKIILRNEF